MPRTLPLLLALSLVVSAVYADESAFSTGPVIDKFGAAATIASDFAVPDDLVFRHSFDVNKPSEAGGTNSTFNAAARFINMHARAGVAPKDMHLAVVIHGKAVFDITNAARLEKEARGDNANAALIKALIAQDVQLIVCGQSAAYYDVGSEDLLPGVQMALSAMTAHAVLQQQGYTLNPF